MLMSCAVETPEGTDVFKALALGAKAVFIGRPALYGLAVNGQDGVEHILSILRDELDNAMALAGVSKIAEINKKYIAHESTFYQSKLWKQERPQSVELISRIKSKWKHSFAGLNDSNSLFIDWNAVIEEKIKNWFNLW